MKTLIRCLCALALLPATLRSGRTGTLETTVSDGTLVGYTLRATWPFSRASRSRRRRSAIDAGSRPGPPHPGPASASPPISRPPACRTSYRRLHVPRHCARRAEDCLYLNVWSADMAPESPAPVMVWIHGGGLTHGTGATGLYDGTPRAEGRRGGHHQLSPRRLRLSRASGAVRGIAARRLGNYGTLDQSRPCAGYRTTSPPSAVIRRASRCSANRPGAGR